MYISEHDKQKINEIIENHKKNGLSENEIYNIIIDTMKAFKPTKPIYDGSGNNHG